MSVGRALLITLPLMVTACNMDSSPAMQELTSGIADTRTQVVPASQAIQQAEIASMDLGTMNGAEVRKAIEPGPHCVFTYVKGGRPVLVAVPGGTGLARSYVKIHGSLVELKAPAPVDFAQLADGAKFRADGIVLVVAPLSGASSAATQQTEADLVFAIRQGLRVGYGGFYSCAQAGLPEVG